jgi:hypothetical protein
MSVHYFIIGVKTVHADWTKYGQPADWKHQTAAIQIIESDSDSKQHYEIGAYVNDGFKLGDSFSSISISGA